VDEERVESEFGVEQVNWTSTAEFFSMGGYGLYVWGSYAVTAIFMLVEPALAARQHQKARRNAAEANEQE
jgi:heme exporter protein D